MTTQKSLDYIIGLILVLLTFIVFGGCLYNYLVPACDLKSVEAFEEFLDLYEKCENYDKDFICKCKDFDYKVLSDKDGIEIKNIEENTIISLTCNKRTAKAKKYEKSFEFPKKISISEKDTEEIFVLKLTNDFEEDEYGELLTLDSEEFLTLVNDNRNIRFVEKRYGEAVLDDC